MESGTGRLTHKPAKATIVGAGNVAWGLAHALKSGGAVEIIRVVARSMESAGALASSLGKSVEATADTSAADCGADLVIVAASDGAIAPIASSCSGSKAVWVHTSGSVNAAVLAAASSDYGVIYPMQTFTRGVAVDLSTSPVYIEASSPALLDQLLDIALSISSNVKEADSEARRRLHCAAVFACNFTNHLWDITDHIASQAGSSLADFFPLIDETLRKARAIGPHEGQTGPARRGARAVMDAHEALLDPDTKAIYHLLSQSIAASYEQDRL